MRWLLCAAIGLSVCACSKDETPGAAGPTVLPGPAEWNRQVTPPRDDAAAAARAACQYQAGALPAETQGASHPNGADIPIDHVLIVMMENRSFDHYFQKLPQNGQSDVSVAPDGFANKEPDGTAVPIYHRSDYCFVDTAHGYLESRVESNAGKMDGFVAANEHNHEAPMNGPMDLASGSRAMGYYDQTDIPFYFWLANEFAIGDHYHASVLGPTWPNRMYLLGATSYGMAENDPVNADNWLGDYVAMRELDWKMYSAGAPSLGMFINKFLDDGEREHIHHSDDFFADAASGDLPPLAFVEPQLGATAADADDEHPPHDMQQGEKFVAKVIDAMSKSPAWPRSAIFITYDEHGGLYDHVPPPPACAPDALSQKLPGGEQPTFDTLGIRVPFMLVSPYAKKHFVGHGVYDHTSIVRFVEARFVLPALTNRDANAAAPWEMFDFASPPRDPPAVTMPAVDQQKLADCVKLFGQ